MIRPLVTAAFTVAVLATAASGALFKPGSWYRELDKPSFTPPDILFPIAWAVLYAMIIASGVLFYTASTPSERVVPLIVYGAQLLSNALWSYLFFSLHRLDLALIDVVSLGFLILATIVLFAPASTLAAALLVPYLFWVSFAAVLNAAILARNGSGKPSQISE